MQTQMPELGEVSYNAANQSFEALATCTGETGRVRLPASFAAPLDAPEQLVRQGLLADAARRLDQGSDLRAVVAHSLQSRGAEKGDETLFATAKRFFENAWNKAA